MYWCSLVCPHQGPFCCPPHTNTSDRPPSPSVPAPTLWYCWTCAPAWCQTPRWRRSHYDSTSEPWNGTAPDLPYPIPGSSNTHAYLSSTRSRVYVHCFIYRAQGLGYTVKTQAYLLSTRSRVYCTLLTVNGKVFLYEMRLASFLGNITVYE